MASEVNQPSFGTSEKVESSTEGMNSSELEAVPNETPADPLLHDPLRVSSEKFGEAVRKGSELLRTSSKKLADFVQTKAEQVAEYINTYQDAKPREAEGEIAPKPQGSFTKLRTATLERTSVMLAMFANQKEAGEPGWLQRAATALRTALRGQSLQAICRQELSSRPCPQLILASCTFLATKGLRTPDIFKVDATDAEVQDLTNRISEQVDLIPPSSDPHLVATLVKQFLLRLPEPVLTYRLCYEWLAAADNLGMCSPLTMQLPAANYNTLKLLLLVCSQVADNASTNKMGTMALATALAPTLLWKQAKPAVEAAPSATAAANKAEDPAAEAVDADGKEKLDEQELQSLVIVLDYLISNYDSVFIR